MEKEDSGSDVGKGGFEEQGGDCREKAFGCGPASHPPTHTQTGLSPPETGELLQQGGRLGGSTLPELFI